jgi:hypothetical protein
MPFQIPSNSPVFYLKYFFYRFTLGAGFKGGGSHLCFFEQLLGSALSAFVPLLLSFSYGNGFCGTFFLEQPIPNSLHGYGVKIVWLKAAICNSVFYCLLPQVPNLPILRVVKDPKRLYQIFKIRRLNF